MHGNARIAGLLAQSDARQQRYPLTIGDEFDNGRKRGGRKGAGAAFAIQPAGGNGLVAEAVALVEQQYTVGRQFAQRYRAGCGLAARHGQHKGVVEERRHAEPRALAGRFGGDQGDIETAIFEPRQQRLGAAFADREAQFRQAAGQGREDFGQEIGRDRRDQTETHCAPGQALLRLGEGIHRLGALDRLLRQRQEFAAEWRGAHAILVAVEQGGATDLLQCQNLLRQSRLRHGRRLGRAAEMAGLGHRHGVAHLFERDCHDKFVLSI